MQAPGKAAYLQIEAQVVQRGWLNNWPMKAGLEYCLSFCLARRCNRFGVILTTQAAHCIPPIENYSSVETWLLAGGNLLRDEFHQSPENACFLWEGRSLALMIDHELFTALIRRPEHAFQPGDRVRIEDPFREWNNDFARSLIGTSLYSRRGLVLVEFPTGVFGCPPQALRHVAQDESLVTAA